MGSSTDAVVTHHLKAFLDQDIEAIMADYDEDAIVITPTETIHGLPEIRQMFLGGWGSVFKVVESFDLQRQVAHGDVGYILWKSETATHSFPVGSDTFVVRDGKIVAQTFAGYGVVKK